MLFNTISKQNKNKIVNIRKALIPFEAFNKVGKAKSELVENRTEKHNDVIKKKEIIKIEILVNNK